MFRKARKMQWAAKLAASKSFVVITDREAAIYIDELNQSDFGDLQVISSHLAALELFKSEIDKVAKDYEKRLAKQMDVPKTPTKIPVKGKSTAHKIPVKKK